VGAAAGIAIVVLLVLLAAAAIRSLQVLGAGETGTVYRNGREHGTHVGPKRLILVPFVDRLVREPARTSGRA
jgi:regulator of protease activity HflC (stomatin/prohibitin superfamily)